MKNVLFFTENNWAYGAIHRFLCKKFYSYGINADVLDWSKEYSNLEFEYMNRAHDYFVTTPESLLFLLNQKIPAEKIVVVAHGSESLNRSLNYVDASMFCKLHKYAAVHFSLQKLSIKLNIPRIPSLLRVGIDTDFFRYFPSEKLSTLGYAGALQHLLHNGQDCKRAFLAQIISDASNLPLKFPHKKMTHLSMPGFYQDFDCLLVTSLEETAGLPAMEAASSGKLVISTDVGYASSSAGIVCKTDENAFIEEAIKFIEYYKDPFLYKEKCLLARNYAVENFDWKNHIEGWVNLFL